jgi:hypothetical protein
MASHNRLALFFVTVTIFVTIAKEVDLRAVSQTGGVTRPSEPDLALARMLLVAYKLQIIEEPHRRLRQATVASRQWLWHNPCMLVASAAI